MNGVGEAGLGWLGICMIGIYGNNVDTVEFVSYEF
jgi:hypothetical protein